MKKTYIIGDVGINHNSDMDTVRRLIDWAAIAGCDCAKFQKRNPDVCVPEYQKDLPKDTPWGRMTYLEYKKLMEFGKKEYDEIDRHCRARRIQWSASVWDKDSLEFLMQYDVPFIKIPSALLTNSLLVDAAKTKKKILLSTGMSTIEETDEAVARLKSFATDFAILHCNSTYPAPLEDLNLSCIKTLKDRYGCEVGYSGHEFRLGTSVAAIYLGASIIERHITLDRSMWGTDQLASVEPQGLVKLVRGIRELERAHGDGIKRVTESEKEMRKKLRGV